MKVAQSHPRARQCRYGKIYYLKIVREGEKGIYFYIFITLVSLGKYLPSICENVGFLLIDTFVICVNLKSFLVTL